MNLRIIALSALLAVSGSLLPNQVCARTHMANAPGLAGTTVLIIRHAEKPSSGAELAPAGVQRAQAYAQYFMHFTVDGKTVHPRYLIAAADSNASQRPRLTIEPLGRALHLDIHQDFADKQFDQLAAALAAQPHGKTILIAWHHGEIPALIRALGVNPAAVMPSKKWPANVFGWVIVIRYNRDGTPRHAELVHENLMPDAQGQ
ncbi:MAG: hypothetical protein NVSMB31_06130 [Vulcanimicrobiaceae bacterium]